MDVRILVGICFVLLILVLFLIQDKINCSGENILPGFWSVSEKFKEEANIDQFVIYFDDGEGYDYQGYAVMVVDGETVFNGTQKFRITPKGYFKGDMYNIIMSKQIGIMPTNITMEINVHTGLMKLKCLNTKKMFAELYKDNQMSAKTILNINENEEESCMQLEEVENSEEVESSEE